LKIISKYISFLLFLFSLFFNSAGAQSGRDRFLEWTTWTLIQSVPSPVFFQDKNDIDSRLQFGLRWQITPFSYCFNVNKLVSPVSSLKVNPIRRHSGSVEILAEPEWTTSDYRYSDFNRFGLSSGIRGYFPLREYGEYLSASFALKYNIHKNKTELENNYYGIEAGFYSFFGIIGLKFNYNFSSDSKFNVSLNLKYF
jgi:hypothetical protein